MQTFHAPTTFDCCATFYVQSPNAYNKSCVVTSYFSLHKATPHFALHSSIFAVKWSMLKTSFTFTFLFACPILPLYTYPCGYGHPTLIFTPILIMSALLSTVPFINEYDCNFYTSFIATVIFTSTPSSLVFSIFLFNFCTEDFCFPNTLLISLNQILINPQSFRKHHTFIVLLKRVFY